MIKTLNLSKNLVVLLFWTLNPFKNVKLHSFFKLKCLQWSHSLCHNAITSMQSLLYTDLRHKLDILDVADQPVFACRIHKTETGVSGGLLAIKLPAGKILILTAMFAHDIFQWSCIQLDLVYTWHYVIGY